jgi:hypothetical protein
MGPAILRIGAFLVLYALGSGVIVTAQREFNTHINFRMTELRLSANGGGPSRLAESPGSPFLMNEHRD